MYTSTSTPFSARMRVTPLQAIIMTIFESNRPLNKKYVWPITAGAVILALYFLHQTGFFQPTTFMQNFDRPPTMPDRTKILRFEKEMGAGVQYATFNGEEVTWEVPKAGIKPTGVVLFGHGCYHSGGDLWPPQPACPRCLGLPEEMRWRRAALARGLAVVGISSPDAQASKLMHPTRCWIQDRGPVLANVTRTVITHLGLTNVPLYLMGVSSGASLLMVLPHEMPEVRGVYSQVKAINPERLRLPGGRKYPPIVFVHMATMDRDNAKMVGKDIKFLKAAGTAVAQVLIEQKPITVEFLTSRSEGAIDAPMAKQIINLIEEKGYFNPDGTLRRNMRPVTEQWASEMQPIVGNLSLERDKSNPGELFNVAFARHEFVHDHVDAVLEWLQNGGKGGQAQMNKLLEADREKDAAAAAAWARALKDGGWL